MCQCLPSGQIMFHCVSGTSKKFHAWGPNRGEILTSPPPHVFAQLDPALVLALCPQVWQHLPSGLKCSYVSQKPPRKFGVCKHNEKWTQLNFRGDNTWPPRVYVLAPDPLAGQVPAHRPLGVKGYLRTACFKILHTHISDLENSLSAPYRVRT